MSAKLPGPWFLVLAAPIVLGVTAGVQRNLAATRQLNPWKGGGFGMFADIHRTAYRVLRIAPIDANRTGYPTPTPVFRKEQVESLKTLPTKERLQAFARELFESKWVRVTPHRNPDRTYVVLAEEAALHAHAEPFEHIAVRVELFEYEFDAATNQLVPRAREMVIERAPGF